METLRTSSYLIDVKLDNSDKYMLIHGYTGAIDIVNEKVALSLKNTPEIFLKEDAPFSEETIEALQKRGYLTEKTQEEEYAYVARMANLLHKKEFLTERHYVWVVTYDCNFRCPYCFEHELTKTDKPWSNKAFSHSMVDNAYASIVQMERNHPDGGINKTMILYGGEPLLAKNLEIVEHIVKKGNELGFKFKAVTNGYELDAYKELLNPNQISALQITIDGIKSCHDTRRKHFLHKSTFDKILKNIELALLQKVRVVVRINTDKIVFDQLEELYDKFKEFHFFDFEAFSIESALLREHNMVTSLKNNIQYMTMREYLSKHESVGYKYGCQFQSIYKDILNVINGKSRLRFRSTYCSSQCNGYIFDPYGNIYPCWDTIGNAQFIIGSYDKCSIELNSKSILWRNHDISYGNKCRYCRYAFLCGGGCLAKATQLENNFVNSDCNSFPIIMRTAVNRAFNEYKAHIV